MALDPTLNIDEKFLPIDGALYSAPTGTTLPTDAAAPLDPAFVGHGLWTSDGAAETSSQTRQEIRAFQLNQLVANPVTGGIAAVNVSLLQMNAENASLYYGDDDVDTTTGRVRWRPGLPSGDRAFVVDKIDSAGARERIVIPTGSAAPNGDRTTVFGAATAMPVAITVLGDDAVIYNTRLVAGGAG